MQIVEFYSTMVIRAVPLSESDSSAVSDSLSSALSEASVWILSFCCFWIYSETNGGNCFAAADLAGRFRSITKL